MIDYHSVRSRIIRVIFGAALLVIVGRLFYLQIVSDYGPTALEQAVYRKVVYPSRGLVYDRKGNIILDNTILYDLVVTPAQVKGVDTNVICKILGIDTAEFKKRVLNAAFKNGRYRPTVFEPLLSEEKFARLNENLYKINQGFDLIARPVRKYPYDAAGPMFGYLGEVDSNFLRKHEGEGYGLGDYTGIDGIEKTYEKVLMGQRGIQYWLRDRFNRPTQRYENGSYDTTAVSGSTVHSSLDMGLQELGERLMTNKLGSIIAIDPKTGGILCIVSGPGYKPSLLTGSERRKHFNELLRDPKLPLLNRPISAAYSPGSTFKTLQALVGLQEGVISTEFKVACSGAFYGCGAGRPQKCLDRGVYNLRSAITVSDNTYFATVMQRVIDNPVFPTVDSSLSNWDNYMYAFGLGHRLGVDIPSEVSGFIPTPKYFNKAYGKGNWGFCRFRSCSIGQGEVNTTPIQVANEMAYIANKGWYKIPHVVDSIDGGDKFGLLTKYQEKHRAVEISDSVFEAVHDGMQGVMESGTGRYAKVPGITVCGKTGTVENYGRGMVKRPNHGFFAAFAPRDNPKIAIMCVTQNSGRFGGTYAAPIVSLMIEKYLKDSITDKARLARIDQLEHLNLIPDFIYTDYKHQDSLDHRNDTAYLRRKGYIRPLIDTASIRLRKEADAKKKADTEKGKAAKDKEKEKSEKSRRDDSTPRRKEENPATTDDDKQKKPARERRK